MDRAGETHGGVDGGREADRVDDAERLLAVEAAPVVDRLSDDRTRVVARHLLDVHATCSYMPCVQSTD